MKILVTGGLGYIGSHVTVMLLERNIEVLCIDNLDNPRLEVPEGINNITQKRPLFKRKGNWTRHSYRWIYFDFSQTKLAMWEIRAWWCYFEKYKWKKV